jgi:hypothetical protein
MIKSIKEGRSVYDSISLFKQADVKRFILAFKSWL